MDFYLFSHTRTRLLSLALLLNIAGGWRCSSPLSWLPSAMRCNVSCLYNNWQANISQFYLRFCRQHTREAGAEAEAEEGERRGPTRRRSCSWNSSKLHLLLCNLSVNSYLVECWWRMCVFGWGARLVVSFSRYPCKLHMTWQFNFFLRTLLLHTIIQTNTHMHTIFFLHYSLLLLHSFWRLVTGISSDKQILF